MRIRTTWTWPSASWTTQNSETPSRSPISAFVTRATTGTAAVAEEDARALAPAAGAGSTGAAPQHLLARVAALGKAESGCAYACTHFDVNGTVMTCRRNQADKGRACPFLPGRDMIALLYGAAGAVRTAAAAAPGAGALQAAAPAAAGASFTDSFLSHGPFRPAAESAQNSCRPEALQFALTALPHVQSCIMPSSNMLCNARNGKQAAAPPAADMMMLDARGAAGSCA